MRKTETQQQYGGVQDVNIMMMMDPQTGYERSRGFGFVTFDTPDAIEQVLLPYLYIKKT